MESHIVKVLAIDKLTHDVLGIRTAKPPGYSFSPGQATEVAFNDKDWIDKRRPFTFTNLPADDHLEFIIKTYSARNGVTNRLRTLKTGDELIIHEVWGAISYKGEGLFIAGGAGVTPFISIFRDLALTNKINGNRLLFANKTKEDIILHTELENLLGNNMVNILSEDTINGYKHGFITESILKETGIHDDDMIYLCGPPPMTETIRKILEDIGVPGQAVVMEV